MRFRFRFSLRWMLIVPVAVGIFVALEEKRAKHQVELAAELIEIYGSFERTRRPFFPVKICDLLPDEYGKTITSVTLGGVALPTGSAITSGTSMSRIKVVTTDTLSRVADLPAMRRIKSCTLVGTSVDNGLADKFKAFPSCKTVTVRGSGVTKPEYYPPPVTGLPLKGAFTTSNGVGALSRYHRDALQLTSDLQMFARAFEGDVDSTRGILRLSQNGNERFLVYTLIALDSPGALATICEAVHDDRPATSSMAARVLDEIGTRVVNRIGLVDALDDERPYVRHSAVRTIRLTPREELTNVQELTAKMHDFATDANRDIRWMVIDWLPGAPDDCRFETILRALSDGHPMVRAAAARGLGQLNDPRAIPCLRKSAEESDRHVRKHSLESIQKLTGVDSKQR